MVYPRKSNDSSGRQQSRDIHEVTHRRTRQRSIADQVKLLNLKIDGWANYFYLGSVSRAYRAVNAHVRDRLRQWLRKKHALSVRGCRLYSARRLYDELGPILYVLVVCQGGCATQETTFCRVRKAELSPALSMFLPDLLDLALRSVARILKIQSRVETWRGSRG